MGKLATLFGLMLMASACGESTPGSGGAGGMAMTTSSTTTGTSTSGAGTTGSSTGTGTGAPTAPVIKSVEPLAGGLHVMWDNTTMNCDKVELDRKKDAGSYTTAFTLAGSATSQHDTQAAAPGMFCYKARCVRGLEKSPDSNEKCGTP